MPDASSVERPLISIITATFNAVTSVQITIDSLRKQSLRDFEWIVIDGASTDGTLTLLEHNANVITTLVSEPDRGIYDAWNKACRHIRGEWVLFLGAGDELAATDVLARCAPFLRTAHPEHDLVYGQVELLSPRLRNSLEILGRPWAELKDRWEIGRPALPPHPGVFHHRSLLVAPEPFDARFRIAADALVLLTALRQKPPLQIPLVVSRVPIEGVSTRLDSMTAVIHEVRNVVDLLGIRPPLGHRLTLAFQQSVLVMLQLLIPSGRRERFADLLRVLTGRSRRWTID